MRDDSPRTSTRPPFTVVDRIAAQQPDTIAFDVDDRHISYRELDDLANRLAHRLVALGVRPEAIVPLCCDPSPLAVVATLAIWKAGAAYLPVDPNWPEGRWRQVLDDSAAGVVLVQDDVMDPPARAWIGELATASRQLHVESLSATAIEHLPPTTAGPGVPTDPDRLAYVIYTSGSTGTPKGVMVEHRSLAQTIDRLVQSYRIDPGDRVLQFAPLCFDVSVEEVLIGLVRGARIIGGARAKAGSFDQFLSECTRHQVTVLELPTAYFTALVHHLAAGSRRMPPSVRLVIIGGEAARPDVLRTWQALPAPRPPLLNAYGLTETTITTHVGDPVRDAADYHLSRVSIGRPLPGVVQRVLDQSGHPARPGAVGQLFVGGTAVARGYLGQPEETDRRFVLLPGSGGHGGPQRFVATGDLVRDVGDQTLEVVGRVDEQLKLRGFRIEPAEVERALAAHPTVLDVVVGVRQGGRKLTAWVVSSVASITLADLQAVARTSLPDYMVPRELILLPRFPLTSSGKVDRRRVQLEGGGPSPDGRTGHDQPRTPHPDGGSGTADIMSMWREVFDEDIRSDDDDFHSLGGDSLQAMQLLARISERYGIELTLREFFAAPTVAGLSAAVRAAFSARPAAEAAPPGCGADRP